MKRAFLPAFAVLALSVPCFAQDQSRDAPLDRGINRALEFLHNNQNKNDGGWGGRGGKNPAINSLAVMAFLSAGHVPGEGRYGAAVEKGVRSVLATQQPNGLFASDGNHEMYHHGIATLMLAEAAGMTSGDLAKEVRHKLQKAIGVILKAQRAGTSPDRGGWRYQVAHVNGSDISVTGWQVMALRGAKNLGCDVPANNISRAVDYIQRCQDPGTGGFRYTAQSYVTVPCTGTSILALEICGKDLHKSPEVLKAGAFLLRKENLPRWGQKHFFYSVYYCSQATFQMGDNYWSVFRPKLHEVLLRNQSSNGSWSGGDSDAYHGTIYCTAMAVLSLTPEYRFLPIYQRGEEPSDKK